MEKYRAYKYDMLILNCNHFSNEFICKLFNEQRVNFPNWINRAAYIGSWFHCIVPTRYITVAPEGREKEGLELAQKWKEEEISTRRSMSLSTLEDTPRSTIDHFYQSLSKKSLGGDTTELNDTVSEEDDQFIN